MTAAADSSSLVVAFSTLACPEWDAIRVVDEAASMGFGAIEWRGGAEGHVRPSWSRSRRRALRRRMDDRRVQPLCVTAYSSFVSPDPAERTRNVEDLVRHLELAADLGAPFVRAFPGIREDAAPEEELHDRIAGELRRVADIALDAGIVIAIEQHDDFDRATQVAAILNLVGHPAVGAVWDVANGWAAGEDPEHAFSAIRRHLCYAQLKDGIGPRDDRRPTRFGLGDVPLQAAVAAILASDTVVPLSIEWLRSWFPDIDPPEIALPESLRYVRALVAATESAAEIP